MEGFGGSGDSGDGGDRGESLQLTHTVPRTVDTGTPVHSFWLMLKCAPHRRLIAREPEPSHPESLM